MTPSTCPTILTAAMCLTAACLLSACAAGPNAAIGAAETPAAGQTIRLLTIGNSFSRNATRYLDDIVAADGRVELVQGRAWIGGCSLERHWSHVEKHIADANDPAGKPYGGKSLQELLAAEPWDVVTIQQLSVLSDQPDSYQPWAGKLAAYIRANAPAAELWLHETWAYRADDTVKYAKGYTQQKMYRNLRAAYHAIAVDLGVENIIPVGDAFQLARMHPDWQFVYPDPNFDYDTPAMDELPDQAHSLCVGWFWRHRQEPVVFMQDTHHAGVRGEYLGACVWFERLTGLSVVGNGFTPEKMTRKEAEFLQMIAHKTVAVESNNHP